MTSLMIYDTTTHWGLDNIPLSDFVIVPEDNSQMFGDVRIHGMQTKRVEATVEMTTELSENFGRLFNARSVHTLEVNMGSDTFIMERCKASSCNWQDDGQNVITWVVYGDYSMAGANRSPTKRKSKSLPKLDWKEVGF